MIGVALIKEGARIVDMSKTTYSAPRYVLGATDSEGHVFLFTGLGPFRSGLEACEAWRAQPRSGVAYVFEERDASKYGVVYGLMRKIVATATVRS